MTDIRYFVLTLLSLKAVESNMEGFVVGGIVPVITKFPHSVFLKVKCNEKNKEKTKYWSCGGSVLNQKIILTAAHCMYGCDSTSTFNVNMGHVNKDKGFSSMVRKHIIHKAFKINNASNDIGLAFIKGTIEFNSNIKRIAIVESPPYFEKSQIAGWGFIDEITNKEDDFLRYIDQYVWKRDACLKVLKQMPHGTICARSEDEESYSSGGDSGSALVVRDYIQIGIVSYKDLTYSRSVVVYTDTGYFYNWIKENARTLYCY
ncbi:trypsin delta/gamma-like protein CG30031 [Spodoptera litura]|uniref:Trypsin delta/gamma-like protein CG30031 n=1 Tax=Spodoptera litura TaxID=69820 RepID=A0A9J7EPK0_SPOLT|nr:trypsin delta/gamma-like protein CG30031 [Spodoptera litura]